MTFKRPSRVGVSVSLGVVVFLVLGEIWWHSVPLLERVSPSSYYYSTLQLASQKMQNGEMRSAEDLVRLAISKFPETSDAYQMLGDILAAEGNKNAALTNYQLALQRLGGGFTNILSVKQQLAERPLLEKKIREVRR